MEQPAAEASGPGTAATDANSLSRIQTLLKAPDDTQRFVGLALLKSVLDNSPQLRENEGIIQDLWGCLSAKFLERLLRTGSNPDNKNAKDLLDLVVSVLHTFAVLLPDDAKQQPKLVDRIPRLVGAILYSSEDTTKLVLQLLHTLVSFQPGARAFAGINDLTPLTEIAPAHGTVLDILYYAWLNAMTVMDDKSQLSAQVRTALQSLVSSFTNTDAVTLLDFLGKFFRQAESPILPPRPPWLKAVVGSIQKLVTSRPTPEARSAYTNAAASLLKVYSSDAAVLLFHDEKSEERPFAYLLINLLLIDIRSSAPTLIEKLNSPEYQALSLRLSSAFDIICIFIGHLIRSLDDESLDSLLMAPDNLLKLRKGISETMSVTIEYLRDRWDASVAGAMGLHPDARVGTAETATGSRYTLVWDSMKDNSDNDPFILSAIRALSLWLREDDNELLRKEATGLTDMLLDLYKSSAAETLDFRSPVLVAFEALCTLDQGRELFLNNNGWQVLVKDLTEMLQQSSYRSQEDSASRGIEIVRVLLAIVEQEHGGAAELWMDLITATAAWNVPDEVQLETAREFEIAVLQLCCAVLVKANTGMRSRFSHSIGAIAGIATQLSQRTKPQDALAEAFANAGKKTGLVERAALGGTCVNVGCTPTKTMIASGRVAYLTRRSSDYGVQTNGKVNVDMARVRERKRDIVKQWNSGSVRGLKDAGVDVLMGEASFVGPRMLRVQLTDGGEVEVGAGTVFLCVGERSLWPTIPGLERIDKTRVLDSTSIMELSDVPSHLVVLGGGYIGLEFGQLFRRLGAKVTIVQRGKQLLPREDADVADCMRQILEEDGITIHLSTTVESVDAKNDAHLPFVVNTQTSSGTAEIPASHLLLAAGRVPNTDSLNLSIAGVKTTPKGHIVVDDMLRSSAPGIYALGDCHGGPAFTHMSYDDFRIVRTNLLPDAAPPTTPRMATTAASKSRTLVPYVVYTDPQLGHVGLHARDLEGANRNVKTATMPMAYVARAVETDEKRGLMKATVDAETGEILGFTCLGLEGGEIMSIVQTAMMGGLKWWDLEAAVWSHPTLAEGLNSLWAYLK
ncbi:putative pyridine nucleotide-disulfide oxidoreductase RclA [Paramyrothecium foliicola]|nr:putative pyridine nucleotide-disulfide oxidoreductase RclA [Paramyrothecium foliicola]